MGSLIASLASSAGGLVALLAVVAGLIGSGAYVEHRVDTAKLNAVELSYAQAEAKAVAESAAKQKELDDNALAASNAEVVAQQGIAQAATSQLDYLRAHPIGSGCVPYLLVRVLDAAILGVSPANLALPAGKSDHSCSAFSYDDLARTVTSNYASARANAEQLNALIALVRKAQIVEKH